MDRDRNKVRGWFAATTAFAIGSFAVIVASATVSVVLRLLPNHRNVIGAIIGGLLASIFLGGVHAAAYSSVSKGIFWTRVHILSGAGVGFVLFLLLGSSDPQAILSGRFLQVIFWSALLALPGLAAVMRAKPRV